MKTVVLRWVPTAAFVTLGLAVSLALVPIDEGLLIRIYALVIGALGVRGRAASAAHAAHAA